MNRLLDYRQRRPLVWMGSWVFLFFLVYLWLPVTRQGQADFVLTTLLTIAFGRAIWLMIRHTRIWTWRGQGLLGTVIGDSFLYFSLGAALHLGFREQFLDMARAFLTVGVIHLLIGLEPHVTPVIPPDELQAKDPERDPHIVENVESKRPGGSGGGELI